jgi:dipeptidyl aminopeptidase/acylaminoacyl peptidase
MRCRLPSVVTVLLVASWVAAGPVVPEAQPARAGQPSLSLQAGLPELPSGAIRLVNHARHGSKVAMCAEAPGPPLEQSGRLIPRTRVWVDDGITARLVGTAPGTCDPAWSPDGERVAVVAPNGLWVLSADLSQTMHLVDTRHSQAPGDELAHRTLSSPQWAPDASRLAFLVSSGATSWVEAIDARTGRVVHTSDPETYEFTWGADSKSLHFGPRVVRLP